METVYIALLAVSVVVLTQAAAATVLLVFDTKRSTTNVAVQTDATLHQVTVVVHPDGGVSDVR